MRRFMLVRVVAAGVAIAGFQGCGPEIGSTLWATHQSAAGGRTVHVALTAKGEGVRFFSRWATEDSQVVASDRPVEHAEREVVVQEGVNEQLAFVELDGVRVASEDKALPSLPGEVARFGNVAVIVLPAGVAVHEWVERIFPGRRLYGEAIGDEVVDAGAASLALPLVASRLESQVRIDIDPAFLDAKLRQLSGAVPATVNGVQVTISERRTDAKRALTRAWLKQEYEALGFTVAEHPYSKRITEASGGVNLVAERAGRDPNRWLIVSAHYDSVGNAGADDDGAGTISALAVARALAPLPLAVGIRVLAFDQEELGLLGSTAYVSQLNEQGALDSVVGVLNLEMTGYDADGDGAFHAIDCNENTSASLTQAITRVVARDGLALEHVAACTNRSDHAAFWRYSRPAIVVSQNFFGGDDNPCYHRACDTIDNVNLDYMTKVTTAVARAAADLAVGQ